MNAQTGSLEVAGSPGKSSPRQVLDRWLTVEAGDVNQHVLWFLCEKDNTHSDLMDELRELMQDHYVASEVTAQRLASLGAPQTADLLRMHLPTKKASRSGDMGEMLAAEIVEGYLGYDIPIRRLRWKDGRDMALRGDDIVGIATDADGRLRFLKGEAKSREQLSPSTVSQAAKALDRDEGRPSQHSVMFVCDRLCEQHRFHEALELANALSVSFDGYSVEHLLFTLSGNDPRRLLSSHLTGCTQNQHRRQAVGVHVEHLGKFVEEFFGGF